MAIPPLSGSLSSASQPSEGTPVDRADVFETTPIVKDVTVNRNAYVAEDYPRTSTLLTGYVEGATLTVTYYQSLTGGQGRQSITDLTALRDNINIPLLKIAQFEMKVPSAFTLAWDGEAAESTVTGDAVVYPGFAPKIGDVFIYTLSSGQVGAFVVGAVEPLSYYNERLHRVSFHMRSVATAELVQLLEDRVKKRVVFDKQLFLSGNRTLLTEDSYALNRTLLQMRRVLAQYYYREFYSVELDSVLRPDGIYDPYLVQFLNELVSYNDVRRRARQLYPLVDQTYRHSLWARLLDSYNLGLDDLCEVHQTQYKHNTYLDVGITALVNRQFVLLRPELQDTPSDELPEFTSAGYVLSSAFYSKNTDDMTAFEQRVYTAITTRTLPDVAAFIAADVDTYHQGEKLAQFYHIPLTIRLMDIARSTLAPNIR